MASFNKVILVGNLTRDPQVKYTTGGTAVTEIGLAVNRRWLDKQSNQWKDETTFVDVTLWGRTAEIAGEYLAKGRPVLIEGRLQLDTWDDRESGQKRSKLRVVGENMTMLGGKGEGGGGGGGGGRAQSGAGSRAPSSGSDSEFQGSGDFSPSYDEPSGASQNDDVPF
jgi:single-strand DNA-binding protein